MLPPVITEYVDRLEKEDHGGRILKASLSKCQDDMAVLRRGMSRESKPTHFMNLRLYTEKK